MSQSKLRTRLFSSAFHPPHISGFIKKCIKTLQSCYHFSFWSWCYALCELCPILTIPLALTWPRLVASPQGQQEVVLLTGHGSTDHPIYKQERKVCSSARDGWRKLWRRDRTILKNVGENRLEFQDGGGIKSEGSKEENKHNGNGIVL